MQEKFVPDDHLPGYPIAIPDMEAQSRWEAKQVEEGVRRYRKQVAEAELGDTPPGIEAMRDMMSTLVPAVQGAREEAIDGIANAGKGRQPSWWWTIAFLSPEKTAFITCRSLLTVTKKNGYAGAGVALSSVSLRTAGGIKQEMEFEAWREREKELEKSAKDGGDYAHVNLYKVLTERAPRVDARAFARWRKKIDTIRSESWATDQRLQLGTKLVDLAVRHGGGWFEKRKVVYRGKTENRVFLTDIAKAAIEDAHSRLEVNRPFLMPMKCPPKPWRKSDG